MTKEITKAIILQEMQDKLKLRDFDPTKFLFEETVIPVYSIEPHLKTWVTVMSEKSVTGTGALNMFTIPGDERWTFNRYDVVFMGAGAYTVSGLYVRRLTAGVTNFIYLDMTAGQTVSYHIELPMPVVIGPKDFINLNIDGYTSTQDVRVYLDYTLEYLR